MESGKLNNSSSSGDQQEKSSDDEARILGRSYDCNFCKRGFTNAQALGGHMNIHRKDKAKAKRNSKEPSSTDQLSHFPIAQTTYQVYLPSPTYYYQQGYNNNPFDYQAPWTDHGSRGIEDHHHGGLNNNLSLNFGTPSYVNQFSERRNEIEDDSEVDLELRLGNHHW